MAFQWRDLLRVFPAYQRLEAESCRLKSELEAVEADRRRFAEWSRFFPPGHYYSPLPSQAEIDDAYARLKHEPPFADIAYDTARQYDWLERLARHYGRHPFVRDKTPGRSFYLSNTSYPQSDALILFCMLAELQPRRVIEIGSGFTSAAMLDANERVFGRTIQLTFIDPNMERLRSVLSPVEENAVTLVEKRLQEVDLALFRQLNRNDVLFIDSSHVSKVGSDVNRIFFDILPVLNAGVFIHFHDIPGNFEYPREWLEEGRAWNEVYLLRAFLMNNPDYRIEILTSWLRGQRSDFIKQHMPLCADPGGGQIWIQKLVAPAQ